MSRKRQIEDAGTSQSAYLLAEAHSVKERAVAATNVRKAWPVVERIVTERYLDGLASEDSRVRWIDAATKQEMNGDCGLSPADGMPVQSFESFVAGEACDAALALVEALAARGWL